MELVDRVAVVVLLKRSPVSSPHGAVIHDCKLPLHLDPEVGGYMACASMQVVHSHCKSRWHPSIRVVWSSTFQEFMDGFIRVQDEDRLAHRFDIYQV